MYGDKMQCKIKRTIFDLFTYYDCNDCIYRKQDQHFNYEDSFFHIYYLYSTCFISEESKSLFFFDSKVKRFLYDAIYFQKEILFILVEASEEDTIYNYINIISCFSKNIQILII
ncbi:MAG: hypothetical protein WCY04_02520 [Bacilli bacterium]|jgi:hypothetical protein